MRPPREIPMLFSQQFVPKLLDGTKCQTRRPLKPQPPGGEILRPAVCKETGEIWEYCNGPIGIFCPCKVGDLIWAITLKPVPDYERTHAAGDDGHIYRIDKAQPTRLRESIENGYHRICMCRGGHERIITAHEMVCGAFYGHKPSCHYEVRHLDGNRSNNKPENLDWGTKQQNWQDRKHHGRGVRENHHNAKLNMAIASAMRSSGKTAWALSKEYGVSSKTVANVLSGRTWVESDPAPVNMPRWAARIFLLVTDVRVERLQEITQVCARAEGITDGGCLNCGKPEPCQCPSPMPCPTESFIRKWHQLYGETGLMAWHSNPWVSVTTFKRVEKP